MKPNYTPPQPILDKYADVMVNFAAGKGKGVKPKETVFLTVSEVAKPMLIALRRKVLEAGAYPIIHYLPDDISREYYELASEDQLSHFPAKYIKGRVDEADHTILMISETNKQELKGIDPKKIMLKSKSMKKYREWRDEKENKGKFTWTLALYGTKAMAKEAGLSEKEYWDQIIKACFLDQENPVKKWQDTQKEINRVKSKLNKLDIKTLHLKSKDTDLTITMGKNRKWLGGSGANIPSFELFTSPDWRGTNGKISFNQPLYRYGNLIDGVSLEFKDGKVVKAKAKKGEKVLKEMIKVENADKIGEFSLTDSRLSRITKFMAETLFDENVGGKYGNTHLALGSAYHDTFRGDKAKMKKSDWKKLGFNDSVVHTDIVSTEDRVVTAELANGSKKVIYKSGKFTI